MIFIDTGAFLARYVVGDQYHVPSLKIWEKLNRTHKQVFTSNFVLDETFTLLARKTSYPFAAERAKVIYSSEILQILRPEKEHEIKATQLFEKYSDQKISFTDCVSFALMHANRIEDVFTFDSHFERVGFRILS